MTMSNKPLTRVWLADEKMSNIVTKCLNCNRKTIISCLIGQGGIKNSIVVKKISIHTYGNTKFTS